MSGVVGSMKMIRNTDLYIRCTMGSEATTGIPTNLGRFQVLHRVLERNWQVAARLRGHVSTIGQGPSVPIGTSSAVWSNFLVYTFPLPLYSRTRHWILFSFLPRTRIAHYTPPTIAKQT
jgi:hypothetical protein